MHNLVVEYLSLGHSLTDFKLALSGVVEFSRFHTRLPNVTEESIFSHKNEIKFYDIQTSFRRSYTFSMLGLLWRRQHFIYHISIVWANQNVRYNCYKSYILNWYNIETFLWNCPMSVSETTKTRFNQTFNKKKIYTNNKIHKWKISNQILKKILWL